METCFLNHLLLCCVSVLLLLPGPLWAGTPGYNRTAPVTDGLDRSAGTDGLSGAESGATSTSSSSESLSPSQRDLLLSRTAETRTAETRTAAARSHETEQTEVFTETSSKFQDVTNLSTEPPTSSFITTSDFSSSKSSFSSSSSSSISSSDSGSTRSSSSSSTSSSSTSSSSSSSSGLTNTNQMAVISHSVSTDDHSLVPEDETLPQDSPDTTLRLGDATSSESQTDTLTGSTYTTTVSRAGERTLLSVTSSNNSTSPAFTQDSSSLLPPSTWSIPPRPADTEGYTQSAPATRTNGEETTEQHVTGTSLETEGPAGANGTPGLTGQPNATKHQLSLTSQEITGSTPPLRVTQPSTDQSETPVSSTPPLTSYAEVPVNASGTDPDSGSSERSSTEMTTGAHSPNTQNQEGTEGLSSQTSEGSVSLGLTAVPSTVSSLSDLESQTHMPGTVTETFLSTVPVTATERSETTVEVTFKSTAFTTTAMTSTVPPLPATSAAMLSSSSSAYTTESTTETALPSTSNSTTASTPALQTSTALPTVRVTPSQTQRPSTKMTIPTKATTAQTEMTTGHQKLTTTKSQYIITTNSPSTTASSTEAPPTTKKQTDGATEAEATTRSTTFQTTKVPRGNPCVSNPCLNGGICVSYKGPEYTCQCQKAWTGSTCNQDMDECEQDPCPAGTTCINTKGSFNCECPLGYDLEDGRTCSRAKTFLGTFSFNRNDQIKRSAMYEIQRELIQLLNISLSVLQGYSRSILRKKEQGGVQILAVNMFAVSTNVTTTEVYNSIQMSLSNCSSSLTHCRMVLQHQLSYRVESLCEAQKTQCDAERSTCTDSSGTAQCQCLPGYYKHNPEDVSCLGNGDMQMSPYADFPKNNRISMEWGRETIEMQENGSTKNLLQMTDIYYSPALRNADLERNGLYPFTGMPGSRHSCIYPAQWNPSFISDDSRRRDYF
ncbi:PREDICTED: protein HEG homolog 1 [Cyprinodon variegatus]|uniref:protein HEG homolog 1 n=1 Tax=Cyprinodon variegatus TaxID=28743 RepID=UPI0007426FC1|nr:PREDICTED: protein HEG homolog 1 [Cyprinodon variegatus]